MDELGNNVRRLFGVHAMSTVTGSALVGISPQALYEIQSARKPRRPSLGTADKLAQFFEISIDRLLNTPFRELLQNEVADASRFDRVEAKVSEAGLGRDKTSPGRLRRRPAG
jgi:transcriptional regulator with XRE-family HTH domain